MAVVENIFTSLTMQVMHVQNKQQVKLLAFMSKVVTAPFFYIDTEVSLLNLYIMQFSEGDCGVYRVWSIQILSLSVWPEPWKGDYYEE